MPVFIQLRIKAMCLVNAFRRSLVKQPDMWTIDADPQGRPIVSAGPFRIMLVPRPARVVDAVHLYFDDAEVWLPLVPRIRLRNALRLLILRRAHERWMADFRSDDRSERDSAPRRSRRQAQPA
jgi:hypothetical protein